MCHPLTLVWMLQCNFSMPILLTAKCETGRQKVEREFADGANSDSSFCEYWQAKSRKRC